VPHWDFGDGTGADEEQPAHTYAAPGRYRVSVVSRDALGNPTAVVGDVVVAGPPAGRGRAHPGGRPRRRAPPLAAPRPPPPAPPAAPPAPAPVPGGRGGGAGPPGWPEAGAEAGVGRGPPHRGGVADAPGHGRQRHARHRAGATRPPPRNRHRARRRLPLDGDA